MTTKKSKQNRFVERPMPSSARASSDCLYTVLQVSRDASGETIRKAYYKASLASHPDKGPAGDEEEKARRTALFQSIGEAYRVLADSRLRSVYDRTGEIPDRALLFETGEDGQPVNWSDYFRGLFQSVTAESIQKMRLEYVGSDEELADLYSYYRRFEGDMNMILEHLMFSSPEEEPRYRLLIEKGLESKQLRDHSKWHSTMLPAQMQRRWKRAKSEAASASTSRHVAKLRLAPSGPGRGASAHSEQDLFTAIAANRQKSQVELLEKLERKYGSPCSNKASALAARTADPLSDAEFRALQERLFKRK